MSKLSSNTQSVGGENSPLLRIDRVSKNYPGVLALNNVSLSVFSGTGHALIGENGAGKSTLIKIISGFTHPDSGSIYIDGEEVNLKSPSDAHRRGIALVPQEISLIPSMSIAENIFAGHLPHLGGIVKRRDLLRATREITEMIGITASVHNLVGSESPAIQQLVMIARGIVLKSRVFILDEPTAALSDPEIESLFKVIKNLKEQGSAIIYVSHRLAELKEVADEITVLRDGEVVAHLESKGALEADLVRAMIGRAIEKNSNDDRSAITNNPERLTVKNLTRKGAFENISFSIKAGEVVGLAGIVGAGRTEVARAIFGLDSFDSGDISVDNEKQSIKTPKDAIVAGIVLVPEERKTQALILGSSISNNVVLPHLSSLSSGSFLRESILKSFSKNKTTQVGVKAPSVNAAVGSLSGGNQQKVVLSRWLTENPKIYILDEPTRGIDVGAKAEIYGLIKNLASAGASVLVISSELTEILKITDRVLIMKDGNLAGELETASATEESILSIALGAQAS